MYFTLTQAAEATGKSKSTLLRAIRKGRISANRDEHGAFLIDPAELHRVFPLVSSDAPNDASLARHALGGDASGAAMLRREVELLREQLAREREFSRELANLLHEEREERRKLTAMLTHQAVPALQPDAPSSPRLSLVEKLFSRRIKI